MIVTAEEQAEQDALREIVRHHDRPIWLMAKQSGGKVTIAADMVVAYDASTSGLVFGHTPSGCPTIEAVSFPPS